ncbi:hypothetical protein Q3G72_023925 [Acer saccharum]|nr:hypothetical protein Q3G72_023925 [Acer saccharum]
MKWIKLVLKACCINSGHRLKLRVRVLFHFAFVTVPSIFCERESLYFHALVSVDHLTFLAANSCFVLVLFGHAVDDDFILPHHLDRIFEAYVMLVNPNEKLWRFPDHRDCIHTRINSQNKCHLIIDLKDVLITTD